MNICKKYNKFISGGSDYHAKNKPNINLGTGLNNNIKIEYEIIKSWADKIGKIYPEYSLEKIDYVINFILKDNYSEEGINDDEKKEIIDLT